MIKFNQSIRGYGRGIYFTWIRPPLTAKSFHDWAGCDKNVCSGWVAIASALPVIIFERAK